MANWPAYQRNAQVSCFRCDKAIGPAHTGKIIGFGEGNGNCVLTCSCGHKTFYDWLTDQSEVDLHNFTHAEEFAEVKRQVREIAAFKDAEQTRMAGRTLKGKMGQSTKSAVNEPKPVSQPIKAGAFDLI